MAGSCSVGWRLINVALATMVSALVVLIMMILMHTHVEPQVNEIILLYSRAFADQQCGRIRAAPGDD